MSKLLPPLSALRAFEAAGRHLSLTRAAEELHVTPAALSHQVRGLEEHLGQKLFRRLPRALELTQAGRRLLPGLSAGFAEFRQAVARVSDDRAPNILVVSTPPGFTSKWLAARLHRLLAAHPELEVRISSTLKMADFDRDGVDVAIRNLRHAHVLEPELFAEYLVDLEVFPVCSPALCQRLGGLTKPSDLARTPLIHDISMLDKLDNLGWGDWLAVAGVKGVDVSGGLSFNSADHAIEAAVEGAGVALAHSVLAIDDLRSGRLLRPFDLALPLKRAYHVVCPLGREAQPKILAFRAWIREEMCCGEAPPSRTRQAPAVKPRRGTTLAL